MNIHEILVDYVRSGQLTTMQMSLKESDLNVLLLTFNANLISAKEVMQIENVRLHPVKEPQGLEIYAFYCNDHMWHTLYTKIVHRHCARQLKNLWIEWQNWPILIDSKILESMRPTLENHKKAVQNFVPWYERRLTSLIPSGKRQAVILKRCKEIEEEADNLQKPARCSADDIAEVSDRYQENLEYTWEIERLSSEYAQWCDVLNSSECKLFPENLRLVHTGLHVK